MAGGKVKILEAPLDWGLGHATRCVPVIREFLAHGAEVEIAVVKANASFFRETFPKLRQRIAPGYNVEYPDHGYNMGLWLLKNGARLNAIMRYEHRYAEEMVARHHYDILFSDNRFAFYSKKAHNVYMTHQRRIAFPPVFSSFEGVGVRWHDARIAHFDEVWVPDVKEFPGYAGTPWEGPVLLVGNHISYIDWAMIQMASPRPMRFVITRRPFEKWYVRLLLSQMETIDLDISNPGPAMEEAHKALLRGEAVVMFPENVMTSTGNMNRFRLDYSAAIKDVPHIKLMPFYVQGLWGSSYSMAEAGFRDMVHSGGRIVSVAFGKELPLDSSPMMVKRAVQELSITAWTSYIRKLRPVASAWIRTVKHVGSGPSVFSPDGNHLTANALATAALSFGAIIDKLTKGEKQVGGCAYPAFGPRHHREHGLPYQGQDGL